MPGRRRVPIPNIDKLSAESKHFYDVINKEPDLVCALVATSYLEYALGSLLKRHFVEGEIATKVLEGCLSTFANRYDSAYALGLITKSIHGNLKIIGEIRNLFAHTYLPISFDDSEVVEMVNRFVPFTLSSRTILGLDGTVIQKKNVPFPWGDFSPRDKFNIIAVYMLNFILITGLKTKNTPEKLGSW
jgi:hypothetical protein